MLVENRAGSSPWALRLETPSWLRRVGVRDLLRNEIAKEQHAPDSERKEVDIGVELPDSIVIVTLLSFILAVIQAVTVVGITHALKLHRDGLRPQRHAGAWALGNVEEVFEYGQGEAG